MDEDVFKIYIEQLRDGHEKDIDESLSPSFLEVKEPDLVFEKEIKLEGKAYLAEQELILDLSMQTEALIPCSICNEKVPVEIDVRHFYYSEPTMNIKSGIFNIKNLIRETILLEVPAFIKCHGGDCPRRVEIEKYLKNSVEETDQDEGYQPFADLDWK